MTDDEDEILFLSSDDAQELLDAFVQLSPEVVQVQAANLHLYTHGSEAPAACWALYQIRHRVLLARVRELLGIRTSQSPEIVELPPDSSQPAPSTPRMV